MYREEVYLLEEEEDKGGRLINPHSPYTIFLILILLQLASEELEFLNFSLF